MIIRTRLSSANLSLEVRVPTKERPDHTQENILFRLMPTHERDHLDLDTGEVFQDYNYARLHKNEEKLIYATMTIRACLDASDYQYNRMLYFAEQTTGDSHFPSSIHFNVYIAPTAFRELADNIRRGLFPNVVTIELVFSRNNNALLKFGWEPDGSGMIWHNKEKENQKLAIESVRFDYEVAEPRYDEKQMDRPLPMQFNAPTDHLNEQIAPIQASLGEMLKYLRWIAMGIVALVIMIAILFVKHEIIF
jgi:hypothetical protein